MPELKKGFSDDITVPPRHIHSIGKMPGKADNLMLLMPAWKKEFTGVKIVSVFPENSLKNIPIVNGIYVLVNNQTGEISALMDGKVLTARRTAATSALASSFLSKRKAGSMLMIGTGTMAPELISAHAQVRTLKHIYVWGRNFHKAVKVAEHFKDANFSITPIERIEDKISEVDIISSATPSLTPLIKGKLLRPGQYIDLVGGYTPEMREADSETMKISRIFVDSHESALKEPGDILTPLNEGVISPENIQADLFELCKGLKKGRTNDEEIICFKSVGHALEDLVAAGLINDYLQDNHFNTFLKLE